MELTRKFYDWLKDWKNRHRQECLLIKGARQIGKTYIVEKLGREEYESFIEFNFVLEPELTDIFEGSLKAEDLLRKISEETSADITLSNRQIELLQASFRLRRTLNL